MCGIAGQVVPAQCAVDEPLVRRMTRRLAHRGPDGERVHIGPQHGFGHRRLSLIDLDGGHQPQANEDGTVRVVANSEIYNYVELRRDLVSRGHHFATSSDTEVIVHLYEEHGAGCVNHLNGMFAFALWDERTRTLLLARDRFGIKPLYYTVCGDTLLFASELRALLESPRVARDLNDAALHDYFRHLTVPEPHSILAAVRKLPAAHVLTWRDGRSHETRYWDITQTPGTAPVDDDEAIARMGAALADSVAMSLRSDAPVGVFLSGGVDSSLLAAIASATQPGLSTFSVAFDDPQSDERAFSRLVAQACGSNHHEIEVSLADAADALEQLTGALDEPFADSSAIPTWLLARTARRHVKAVLTGEGADELFGGSPWHSDDDDGSHDVARLLAPAAKLVFTDDTLERVCAPDLRDRLRAAATPGTDALEAPLARCAGPLERRLYADLQVYLPSDLLMKTDRATMLASLEARVPFLNHPFAEQAWRLPARLKLRDGVRKYALKRLGADRLPAPILTRRKQGFSIPMDLWLWRPGRFRDLVLDTLLDTRTRSRGCFDVAGIEAMVRDHDRINPFHGYRLWTLFVFEMWQRQFIDVPAAVSA